MEKYLKKVLGIQVKKRSDYFGEGLPRFYSAKFEMCKFSFNDFEFVLARPLDEDLSLLQLKKHLKVMSETSKLQCALSFKTITSYQRKSMIDQRVPFVVEGTQIYLPFLGMVLTEKYNSASIRQTRKMSPSTQFLFLFLYYHGYENKTNVHFSLREISKLLGHSVMTTSRAVGDLHALGLVKTYINGRTKYVHCDLKQREFLQQGLKYFQNPVAKTSYVSIDADLSTYGWKSGISALSDATMVAEAASEITVGNYLSDIDRLKLDEIPDTEMISFYQHKTVESWKYDVRRLKLHNDFDYVSIIFMLENQEICDERVKVAIRELKERVGW